MIYLRSKFFYIPRGVNFLVHVHACMYLRNGSSWSWIPPKILAPEGFQTEVGQIFLIRSTTEFVSFCHCIILILFQRCLGASLVSPLCSFRLLSAKFRMQRLLGCNMDPLARYDMTGSIECPKHKLNF